MFNTRETAYFIWGAIVLCFLLRSKDTRQSIGGMLKLLFCKKFLYVYAIALTYLGLCLLILHKATIWDNTLIKDTIMWFLFVACPLMFKSAKVASYQHFVKEIVKPLVAISIIFEFVAGLYTFDLWIELLMIPAFVFIAGMLAVAADKAAYSKVTKLLNSILSLICIVALIAVAEHLARHFIDYVNRGVLMQFLIPFTLSLLFIPLLYGLAMFTHYENALVVLQLHFKDKGIYRYAVWKTMLRFNGDLSGLDRWKQLVLVKNLRTCDQVDEAINLIKTLQKAEKEPHTVNEDLGWSPYQVKDVLVSKGLEMPEYKNIFGKEFLSISFPVKISGDGPLADTITYMVLGEQLIATQLQLSLKIFYGAQNHATSLLQLADCAKQLYFEVFGEQLDPDTEKAVLQAKDFSLSMPLATVTVKKEVWNNATNGFSVDFTVTHQNHIA
jgi:hypothetical protein